MLTHTTHLFFVVAKKMSEAQQPTYDDRSRYSRGVLYCTLIIRVHVQTNCFEMTLSDKALMMGKFLRCTEEFYQK